MNKQAIIKLYAKALAEILYKNAGSDDKKIVDNFIKLLMFSVLSLYNFSLFF